MQESGTSPPSVFNHIASVTQSGVVGSVRFSLRNSVQQTGTLACLHFRGFYLTPSAGADLWLQNFFNLSESNSTTSVVRNNGDKINYESLWLFDESIFPH